MSSKEAAEYILGTHDAELWRLGFQHRVWAESATALWQRAGLSRGQTILDIGCGPGYATRDMAMISGPTGRVIAIDVSERFIESLHATATPPGAAPIDARVADVQRLQLEPATIDFAWCRWVLCYLPDPGAVIDAVARALKPGGAFAIQDYSFYRGVRVHPTHQAFERVFEAVDASWRRRGGDPDIGGRLPRLMMDAGLEVREVRPLVRLARPGSMLWNWPGTFFPNYLPILVEHGLLTDAEREAFEREWAARSADPAAYFAAPPMVEVIGMKPT